MPCSGCLDLGEWQLLLWIRQPLEIAIDQWSWLDLWGSYLHCWPSLGKVRVVSTAIHAQEVLTGCCCYFYRWQTAEYMHLSLSIWIWKQSIHISTGRCLPQKWPKLDDGVAFGPVLFISIGQSLSLRVAFSTQEPYMALVRTVGVVHPVIKQSPPTLIF